MVKLLENGNISSMVDSWRDTLVATGIQEVAPSDPDYERWISWLPDTNDQKRARAFFEAVHTKPVLT
jgi:hypothetical protein